MYSSISPNVLLQKSQKQQNLIMCNCSLFLNGGLLLITNSVLTKIFLVTSSILIKTISGNVTKFKKVLTWPWTNILFFHSNWCILRKLIGAFITESCRSQIWSLDPPLKNLTFKFLILNIWILTLILTLINIVGTLFDA